MITNGIIIIVKKKKLDKIINIRLFLQKIDQQYDKIS